MNYLSFDSRALALMRMGVAMVILLDLSIRIEDLEAFYTNTGATPLNLIMENAWNQYYISFHAISGAWQVQAFLFFLAALAAFLLLIGYRTQLMTLLCWIALLSLHNRNVLILQGGDDLLRMTLFWGMFLPWGNRYSFDALNVQPQPISKPTQLNNLACMAYLLQICYVYTGSALLKGSEWHTEGTALYYVYSLDQIAYPTTKWLYGYPELLRILSRVAYYFELLIPLLFFAPFRHQTIRILGVLLIWGFHLFNGATLYIGLFFIIGIVTSIGILPKSAMDFFEKFTKKIRLQTAESFLHIGKAIEKIFPWKTPTYFLSGKKNYPKTFFLMFCMVYVFYWNLSNLNAWHYKMGEHLSFFAYSLRLDQNWGMFAPGVFKDDGWYIHEGITEKNDTINLLSPYSKIVRDKPPHIVKMFSSDRWRKYTENMILAQHAFMRGCFCNYTRRIWNEAYPKNRIVRLRIIYMMEFTEPGYLKSVPNEIVLFECYD